MWPATRQTRWWERGERRDHLVAELVENATTFSPPTTRIEIRADTVGNGFAVEIEDRGLGLPAGELAEINQRLASPPEFDLANSDQLGLFVVGHLAGRTRHQGLVARLPLRRHHGQRPMPHSLIVRADEAGQLASTASPASIAGPPAPANGNAFPAGHVRAGAPEQGTTFSLTGRHQPGPNSPGAAPEPEPGGSSRPRPGSQPQAPEQTAAPSQPPGTCLAHRAQRVVRADLPGPAAAGPPGEPGPAVARARPDSASGRADRARGSATPLPRRTTVT